MSNIETTLQPANAHAIAMARIKTGVKSKPLFVVRANNPNKTYCVLSMLEKTNTHIKFYGFEITKAQEKNITQYEQAMTLANENPKNVRELELPIHRIQEVENVAYEFKNTI